MRNLSWQIGKCKITSIIEVADAGAVIQGTLPDATPETIKSLPWLLPYFADQDGKLKAVVQSFIITTPSAIVLVDTCVGNKKTRTDIPNWHNLQTDFLARLTVAGYPPTKITHVLCTHMHFDHIGWNTQLVNGMWQPTFPNARYLLSRREFEYWQNAPASELGDDKAGFADSILPVYQAGLVDFIDATHVICREITLVPTPGHTIDHMSVQIQSAGQTAIITGDIIYTPAQCAFPDWQTPFDYDPAQALTSRRHLLKLCADCPTTLMLGTHFPPPVSGRVVSGGNAYQFVCEEII